MQEAPEPGLVKDVLRYFLEHPHVIDTPEGVALFRLIEQAMAREVPRVTSALEWLADEGYVLRVERMGSPLLFQLNQDRLEEGRKFVAVV